MTQPLEPYVYYVDQMFDGVYTNGVRGGNTTGSYAVPYQLFSNWVATYGVEGFHAILDLEEPNGSPLRDYLRDNLIQTLDCQQICFRIPCLY